MHLVNRYWARDTLSYREMIALSGLFRRWALYDPSATPERATELIMWSSNYERLADWVGLDWKPDSAFSQVDRMPFTQFVARIEIEDSRVISLSLFRRCLGRANGP